MNIEEIIATVELAEETAMSELAAFGSYDAIPTSVEALGIHDAIESQFAGVFGGRD
jgi:hypothetical protein